MLLGALHGLEPGHSKTMMAAFIIAVRGTLAQAVLLGLAATLSHTAIVWVIGLDRPVLRAANWNTGATEPYLQIASALLIIAVASMDAVADAAGRSVAHAGYAPLQRSTHRPSRITGTSPRS